MQIDDQVIVAINYMYKQIVQITQLNIITSIYTNKFIYMILLNY